MMLINVGYAKLIVNVSVNAVHSLLLSEPKGIYSLIGKAISLSIFKLYRMKMNDIHSKSQG